MAPPARILNWLKTTYPRPQINIEWLDACCEYITGDLGVDPNDFESLRSNVEEQFLQSNLADSVLPNTGFPAPDSHDVRIKNILCEVVAITEIGHSAFNLKNVRQARIDKEDLAGLAGDLEDGEDYSVPKYPRSMLRMQISDGHKTMRAIEYRRIPEFELGVTPLGIKVHVALAKTCILPVFSRANRKIYLKDVNVRRGIVFLEPRGIQIKGYQTEELEQNQDRDFIRGLRLRMRLPEEDPNEQPVANARPPQQPANAQNAAAPTHPAAPRPAPQPAPRPINATAVQRPPVRVEGSKPPAPVNNGKVPVVDLDPEDLDLDIEDSYSIGDGAGFDDGHDADAEDYKVGEDTFDIDDEFLQELEQAEQQAMMGERDEVVLDLEEESQTEIKPKAGPSKRRKVEEVIEISD
ncbi:hypothetical protein FRC07_014776 [Ceratobasidium sp. 392]|nr:hypothetical protein FRC07_014776 [Ceratobasidium sp. 392]